MHLSGILRTAQQVRDLRAAGTQILDLTLGDFSANYFPIPEKLLRGIEKALESGATNYPPAPGLLALRKAVADHVERCCGVRYPVESVLITCGGRPVLYGAYLTVVEPGDTVVYSVPSWQNDSYAWLSGAKAVEVEAKSANGFQPTLAELAPHLKGARLVCLCSPGNPTGTAMEPEVFKSILEAVVEENRRREKIGKDRPLFLLYDQIYSSIRVRNNKHRYARARSGIGAVRDDDGRRVEGVCCDGAESGLAARAAGDRDEGGRAAVTRRRVGAARRAGGNDRAAERSGSHRGVSNEDGRRGSPAARRTASWIRGDAGRGSAGGCALSRRRDLRIASAQAAREKVCRENARRQRGDSLAGAEGSRRGDGSLSGVRFDAGERLVPSQRRRRVDGRDRRGIPD